MVAHSADELARKFDLRCKHKAISSRLKEVRKAEGLPPLMVKTEDCKSPTCPTSDAYAPKK